MAEQDYLAPLDHGAGSSCRSLYALALMFSPQLGFTSPHIFNWYQALLLTIYEIVQVNSRTHRPIKQIRRFRDRIDRQNKDCVKPI